MTQGDSALLLYPLPLPLILLLHLHMHIHLCVQTFDKIKSSKYKIEDISYPECKCKCMI